MHQHFFLPVSQSQRPRNVFLLLTCFVLLIGLPAQAQYFKTLYNIGGPCCGSQSWNLIQGRDTNLYGPIIAGGIFSQGGSVYSLTPSGDLRVLHNFDTSDIQQPNSPLVLGADGNLYGVTRGGGAYGYGTLFKMTPDGTPSVMHYFTGGSDGAWPLGTFIRAADGNFYGTAVILYPLAYSIFKATPDGTVTTLCTLDVNSNYPSSLIQGKDGNFYGTSGLAAQGNGSVFKMTPTGKWTVLFTFDGTHGASPTSLVMGPGTNFFGTAYSGGTHGDGVVFTITPQGVLTVLHNFDHSNPVDGSRPINLILASDGNFYGVTSFGGLLGHGILYRTTRTGQFLALHHFNEVNGSSPTTLMQHTNGKMYGSTSSGGIFHNGVLYWFDWALKPFVTLEAQAGKAGTPVGIIGNGFSSIVSVTFNGVPASYTVAQDGYLTATVPYGATTGYVQVTTASGTATSIGTFKVY